MTSDRKWWALPALLVACSGPRPCPPATLATIEAAFAAAAFDACSRYSSLDACPAAVSLRAWRDAEEHRVGCR